MEGAERLLDRLRSRAPAFLFLGQRTWGLEVGNDQLLSLAFRYLQHVSPPPAAQTYAEIFCPAAGSRSDDFLAWLGDQLSSIPLPEWLTEVTHYPWNGVYTSSISERLNEAFRAVWRDVQPVYSDQTNPLHPRNRTRLAIHYLYGALNRVDRSERVPTSKFDLVARAQVSSQLLSRLTNHITPLGTFVIDAYDQDDWLTTERLFPIVAKLSIGQAFLCSVSARLAADPFIAELVKRQRLELIPANLASVLASSEEVSRFDERQLRASPNATSIFIDGNIHEVPREVALRIGAAGFLLTTDLLDSPFELSDDQLYAAFRAFLGESDVSSRWLGYARNLSFVRDLQPKALEQIEVATKNGNISAPVFLLHGQSGSGKTIAAGWLAFELLKRRKVPVLAIEKFDPRPSYNDIDEFCRWAEDSGAPCTVIVWDAMLDTSAYVQLRKVLAGRGRKIVLIGTTYRLTGHHGTSVRPIEAPAVLEPAERSAFTRYLARFDQGLNDLLAPHIERWDSSFLVALYRLLPPTRHQIRAGLAKEAASTEEDLRRLLTEIAVPRQASSLAVALAKAGLVGPSANPALDAGNPQTAHDLVSLVMLAGLLGLDIPFDIVLRALNVEITEQLLFAFRKADLFRWHEDRVGNVFIGARTSLEAKLIAQARIGGIHSEVTYAKRLIEAARSYSPEYVDPEIEFVVDLVHGLGPNGPEEARYRESYRALAASLRRLREDYGVISSRLMLQEATLLREWVSAHGQTAPPDEINQALAEAEPVLTSALQLISDSPGLARHKSNVLVELASLHGTRATQASLSGIDAKELKEIFDKARQAAFRARALDPEHRNPLDVILWTGRNILERNEDLPLEFKAEIAADAYYAFDLIEEAELDFRSAERVQSLKQQLAGLLDQVDLEEQAFTTLERLGSKAGFYIRAQAILAGALEDLKRGVFHGESLKQATRYLEDHRRQFAGDLRCLRLLLRCWWAQKTGQPLFYGERQPIPLGKEDRIYCLGIIDEMLAADPQSGDIQVRYLKAVLLWQLGEYTRANSVWRDLQRDTDFAVGSRRVIKSHISTDPNGVPLEYHGTITWMNPAGTRGGVLLEHGRQQVDVLPLDLGFGPVKKGDAIGPFHIAFNYIGPVADRISRGPAFRRR
jgi:hypothetical protein